MKTTEVVLIAALLGAAPALAAPQDAPSPTAAAAPAAAGAQRDPIAIAQALLDRLDAGDYAGAEALFGVRMAAAVPADRLQAVWTSLPAHAGAASARGTPAVQAQAGMQVVTIPLHTAAAELLVVAAVGADGRIEGFRVQPAQPPAVAAPPPPADAAFEERDFAVGAGDRALPGTLALPKGAAPARGWPAIVLVHGSGAQDRNETIGPNRPFLDIARGLAAQGIAVLRYDKRSKARPQDYANGDITIDSEITDDAVAAVEALRRVPGVDASRVFVLGHSQGATVAPRIAARATADSAPVAGLVLFAAPSRKLLDIVLEQQRRLAVLDDGHTSDEEAAAIAKLQQQTAQLRSGADLPAEALPLRLPAAYWRSTDAVDPVAEAKAAALPMLVLQGARDIQVVDADWQGWKAGFHADPRATFKLYPALNHLGIAGDGEGNLAEYSKPGHVDAQLVADIAAWIGAH